MAIEHALSDIVVFDCIPFPIFTHTTGMTHLLDTLTFYLQKCTLTEIWLENVNTHVVCDSTFISQMKHQLDVTLCRFYFCRITLHVSGASAHHQEYLKLVRRPLVYVLSLQVSHHISLLGPKEM